MRGEDCSLWGQRMGRRTSQSPCSPRCFGISEAPRFNSQTAHNEEIVLFKRKMEREPTLTSGADVDPVSGENNIHLALQTQSLTR